MRWSNLAIITIAGIFASVPGALAAVLVLAAFTPDLPSPFAREAE